MTHMVAHPTDPLPTGMANGHLTRAIVVSIDKPVSEMRVEWPYVILGGEFRVPLKAATANVDVTIAGPDGVYSTLPMKLDGTTLVGSLNAWFAAPRLATYAYTIRLTNRSQKPLADVADNATLATTFQFARRALPQVQMGASVTTFSLGAAALNGALPKTWAGLQVIQEWDEAN